MKRSAFSKIIIATAVGGAVSPAFAADTAEIIVEGKVVPAACSIDITGGGVFDYGILTKAQIEAINGVDAQTTQTLLGDKAATLTLDCGQTDTSVSFRVLDSQPGTASPDIANFTMFGEPIRNNTRKHGLGTLQVSNVSVPIGQYGAAIDNASVRVTRGGQSNLQGMTTISTDNGNSWQSVGAAQVIHTTANYLHSFREAGAGIDLLPQPVAHVTGDLHVQAAINQLNALPDAFSFNGQTTLTLVYLGADSKPLP